MPKLIPQLDEHIIKTAEQLFIHEGFDSVSMRKLAGELDIAVGTLYNYFPNKETLFLSIMQRSWDNTFRELSLLIADGEKASREIRRTAIDIIYDGIKGRGAFALKVFASSGTGKSAHGIKNHDSSWQIRLFNQLIESLAPFGAGFAGEQAERVIQTLIAAIRFFTFSSETGEKEGDIDFLLNIVESS